MLNESTQTGVEMERKALQDRINKEGRELWQRQQEHVKMKKMKEQKEIREMLENYWPWSRSTDVRPRGLRNLRLEELFPNKDYENAKRFVGTLDMGRPGGGAPIVNKTGKKLTRTREDPILRFQFGSHDLRRCVDNTLRYKRNKQEQLEYKKELDQLVEEKNLKRQKEKQVDRDLDQQQCTMSPPWGRQGPGGHCWRHPNRIGRDFYKSLGWSNEDTLKNLQADQLRDDTKIYDKFKRTKMLPSNKLHRDQDKIFYPRKHFINAAKYRKLSPLSDNQDNGVDLVTLLAKDRNNPLRIPLCSTDVTRGSPNGKDTIRFRQGSGYLKELAQQMNVKQEKFREMKVKENEISDRHFSTWDSFWGRPGNGAPRSDFKKQSLNRLLYPQMVPIGVH